MKLFFVLMIVATTLWGGPLTNFKSSLVQLRQGKWQNAAGIEVGSSMDRAAMNFSVTEPWRMKMQIGEWLLLAHVGRNKLDPNRDINQKTMELEKAWILTYSSYRDASGFVDGNSPGAMTMAERLSSLQMSNPPGSGGPNDAQRLAAGQTRVNARVSQEIPDELALIIKSRCAEIAVRKNDLSYMRDAVNLFSKEIFNDREISYFVMAAAHSGQWPILLKALGKNNYDRVLNVFHDASTKDYRNFDYLSIYQILKKHPDIKSMDHKILVPSCEIMLESLQFRDPSSDSWAAASIPASKPWFRSGGVVSWISPERSGLPIAGLWLEDRILLYGFEESPSGMRIEEWELRPTPNGPAGQWEGSCKITKPNETPELRQVRVRFAS